MKVRRLNDSATDSINPKAQRRMVRRRRARSAFTIVELVIVIVVIAVLAAVIVVAYNGVTSGARETALKSDLKNASSQLELHLFRNNSLPADASGLPKSEGTVYAYTSAGKTFCLEASHAALSGKTFHVTEKGNVVSGVCPPTTMQTFTGVHCSALPVYTGSNPSAIRSLTDSRGGTTRTYEIAKLADNNCWMLTSLKLGSTSGSITLTPADSNVANNFTLPQLYGGTDSAQRDYDNPKTYGHVPGDTGSGATNYGYLYNWSAATAGESRTTMPAGSGNASHSICPAGWRLPTGGSPSSDFGQLDVAFGGTGAYVSGGPSIAKWQPSGPFRGSFSGYWFDGFTTQGDTGRLWSASASPSSLVGAFYAGFDPSSVRPGDGSVVRYLGVGVRCLLN